MDWGKAFQRLLAEYRHPDGRPWTGAEIERATGGRVSRTYVSQLRRGYIREPSFSKISAISRAMGFSLDEWTQDVGAPRRTD